MRYTFLIYLDEVKFAGMPPEERDGYAAAMRDYDESLRQGGSLVFASALKLPREATTVRMWEGTLTAADGPFAETKEHLSGFIVVEARDMNDAIRMVSTMPLARTGSIEIRPIQERPFDKEAEREQ